VAADFTFLVRNSSFIGSMNSTNVGDGGAVSLNKIAAVFDHCNFADNNSTFRNGI